MSQFKCIETGNWYSEYQCEACKQKFVVAAEDDSNKVLNAHKLKCREKAMQKTALQMTAANHAKFATHGSFYPHHGKMDQKEFDYLFLGLAGEVGESVDAYKKVIRSLSEKDIVAEQEFPIALAQRRSQIIDELGDAYFYINRICTAFGITPEEVMGKNYAKLTTRYKNTETPHLLGIEGGGVNYEGEEDTHV